MFVLKLPILGYIAYFAFLHLSLIGTSSGGVFRKFKIVHEAVDIIRQRPEVNFKMCVRKFNRTTPVIDADFEVKDPKANSHQVWVEGFERLGLEHIYTKSAVSLVCTYCEFLTGKFVLNRGFRDYGNVPTECPVKVGNYSLRNYVFDEKYLPPFVPGKYWRLDFYMGLPGVNIHSNETAKFSYYGQVVYL